MSYSTIDSQSESQKTRFAQGNKSKFLNILRQQIRLYFKSRRSTRYSNQKIYCKAILIALLFIGANLLALTDAFPGVWGLLPLGLIGLSTTAFLVAHDASYR